MDIRFLGHACFELSDGDTRVLIDPFLNGNPKAAVGADEVNPTHIFLTHGHQDHFDDGNLWVRLTPAWHTSTTPNGTVNTPAGLVIGLGGKVVYHLGDTSLFSDLQLVKQRDEIDVALMCIGGHYTMDRQDGVRAAELVGAKQVIPCHYDTFPPIETDAEAFKSEVESQTSSEVVVLEPGDSHSV